MFIPFSFQVLLRQTASREDHAAFTLSIVVQAKRNRKEQNRKALIAIKEQFGLWQVKEGENLLRRHHR
jgi:hypothetical protein